MTQVTYEEYLYHLGFAHYLYKHSYSPRQHITDVYGLNGIVAKIVRDDETKYFLVK